MKLYSDRAGSSPSFPSVQFSPLTDWVVRGTWGTIWQTSCSHLFCGRPLWPILAQEASFNSTHVCEPLIRWKSPGCEWNIKTKTHSVSACRTHTTKHLDGKRNETTLNLRKKWNSWTLSETSNENNLNQAWGIKQNNFWPCWLPAAELLLRVMRVVTCDLLLSSAWSSRRRLSAQKIPYSPLVINQHRSVEAGSQRKSSRNFQGGPIYSLLILKKTNKSLWFLSRQGS